MANPIGDMLRDAANQADAQGDPLRRNTTTLTFPDGRCIGLAQWYVDMLLLDVPGSYKVPPDDELLVVGLLCHVPEGTPANTRVAIKVYGVTQFETSTVSADAVAHRPGVDVLARLTRLLRQFERTPIQPPGIMRFKEELVNAQAAYAAYLRTATGVELPIHARGFARIDAVPSLDVKGLRVTLFCLRRVPVL